MFAVPGVQREGLPDVYKRQYPFWTMVDGREKNMIARRRKTLAVCSKCHAKIDPDRRIDVYKRQAQYLFIFCGGLLALFVLFVILYMVGIDQWICIGFGAASSSLLVWQTFALNARYGEHGLMKLGAARSHPRYLINRRRITRLFKRQRKEERQ